MSAGVCTEAAGPLIGELLDGVENERLSSIHFNWAFLADAAFAAIRRERVDVVPEVLNPLLELAEEVRRDCNTDSDVSELCKTLRGAVEVGDMPLVLYTLGQTREAVVHLQADFGNLPAEDRRLAIGRITATLSLRPA